MNLRRTGLMLGVLLGMLALRSGGAVADVPAPQQNGDMQLTDDWLQIDGAHSKVFLPGQWSYSVTPTDQGPEIRAFTAYAVGGGKSELELKIQVIEGKKEATAEQLRKIFEEAIVPGAKRQDEKSSKGLRARYSTQVEGEDAVCKALFLREGDTLYMVYLQALAEHIQADPQLEKLMDSVLNSFQPA